MRDDKRLLAVQKRAELRLGRFLHEDERERLNATLEERDPIADRWAVWHDLPGHRVSAVMCAWGVQSLHYSLCTEMRIRQIWRHDPLRFGVTTDESHIASRAMEDLASGMLPDDYAYWTEQVLKIHRGGLYV